MRKMGEWRESLISELAENKEEAIDYLQGVLEESYRYDWDIAVFLYALKVVVEAHGGIAKLAKQTQLAPQTLSKMLSGEETFPVDVLGAILKALGCRLTIAPLVAANSCVERTGETETARMENVA